MAARCCAALTVEQAKLPVNPVTCQARLWLAARYSAPPSSLASKLKIGNESPCAREIVVKGSDMYYETSGQGAPLLLLHGFGGSGRTWDEFVPALSNRYRVIVPDLRGHGRSTNPLDEFTHRQSAQDISALLDRLGFRRVRAMGISTGGMTLFHLATREPDRIEVMVLIGATSYFPEPARAIMRRTTVESLTTADYEQMRRVHPRGDEQIRALRRQFHAFKDSYDDMNFTGPLLSTITAQTLIVHGDRDEFFPVRIPVEMYPVHPACCPLDCAQRRSCPHP